MSSDLVDVWSAVAIARVVTSFSALVEQVLRQLSGTLGAGVKGVLVEGQSRSTTWSDKDFVMVGVFNPVPAADFVQVLVRTV